MIQYICEYLLQKIKNYYERSDFVREFVVNKNDQGQRIDKFLTKLLPNIPQSMLYKSLRKDCVKVNGKHIKDGAYRLKEGDELKLYIKDEFFEGKNDTDFKRITPRLNVIYEDENILLVDKPQGMCVHADNEGSTDTLIEHIKAYLWKKGEFVPEEENTFEPALCNRIDRNTGGIVIAAKNAAALRIMNQKIKDKEMEKSYLCLVWGHLPTKNGKITCYLLKDEVKKQVFVYDSPQNGARTAITHYKVLEEYPKSSLIEARLETGRTHQIRASFAHLGHPLLGDGKYGTNEINRQFDYLGQALYSYKLKFDFKTDGEELEYLNGKVFQVENSQFMRKSKKR